MELCIVLIYPYSRLAYPGGWLRPGHKQQHFAAGTPRLSVVANPGGNVTLLGPRDGLGLPTITGTITTSDTAIGPVLNATTATNNYIGVSFAIAGETPNSMTVACIVIPRASTSIGALFQWGGGAGSASILYLANLMVTINDNSQNYSSGINLTIGRPYFIAACLTSSVSVNFVVRDLISGVVQTASVAALGKANNQGLFLILAAGNSNFSQADLACVMYAINKPLSVQHLVWMAAGPWDFWYPPPSPLGLSAPVAPQARAWIMA